jgi:hypothetical protein
MESFGNELVLFDAHISLGVNVYEGSYKLWQPALANPVKSQIRWIVMRRTKVDLVYEHLFGSAKLRPYSLRYSNDEYLVYERKR